MTRPHDVSQLTTAELELARRLITPGSPAHVPIMAHMQAIDAELAGRAGGQQRGEGQRHDSGMLPGPPPPSARRAGIPVYTSPPTRAGLDAERNQG